MIRKTVIYVASHAAIIWEFYLWGLFRWLTFTAAMNLLIVATIRDLRDFVIHWIWELLRNVFQRLF